jgi:hypothetical protein
MPANDMYGWFPTNQPLSPAAPSFGGGGPLSQMASGLAGSAGQFRPGPGMYFPGSGSGLLDPAMDQAIEDAKRKKLGGAASGASAGASIAGPWGALVGGALGYVTSGGAKDANPIGASGFTGVTMDEARKEGNLARLASNPGGALASSLGVKSNSALGKALDPAGIFGQSRSETPYWESILANPDIASVATPEDLTTGFVGMFRGGRNTFPGRQQYGAKDDEKFLADMAGKINDAYSAGKIGSTSSAQDVFDKAVNPWLESMGSWDKNPENWATAEKAATVGLINNYISGGPLTWSQAHGQEAKTAVPTYLGLASQPQTPIAGNPAMPALQGGPLSQLAYSMSRG